MQSASTQTPGAAAERLRKTRRRLISTLAAPVLAAGVGTLPLAARKRRKNPRVKTRRVTRTFANGGQIRIPARVNEIGAATPYPASINVSGLAGGRVTNVTVTLKGLSHGTGREVCVMLARDTTNAILMVKTGGPKAISNVTLTFDDAAEFTLPLETAVSSGRFQPTSNEVAENLHFYFPPPAPLPSGNSLLSAFRGLEAEGSWRLYVADSVGAVDGAIAGGWELTITADVPKKRKKNRKKR